jgi:hypothetical protein
MERVLPKTLDYTDVLPLAVESRARRRTFFPVNGQSFASNGANIIRIDLSADALLDTQHSYLRFKFTAPAGHTSGVDFSGGHGFIKRLRIEQSGVVLEDINSYHRLMGAIVLPCQSGNDHHKERSLTEAIRPEGGAAVIGAATTQAESVIQSGAAYAQTRHDARNAVRVHNGEDQLVATSEYTFCIPLNSGLLNCDKLVPLMLMSAPLTIEIELAPETEPIIQAGAAAAYTISDVRYIANLVEVGGDVAQQLRMVQEMSGGVLTLAGQTYRHFTGQIAGGAGDRVVNVPARVKSMKSLFFACQDRVSGLSDRTKFTISFGGNMGLDEYQLKIGSVVYPPTPVKCDFRDGSNGTGGAGGKKGEQIMELAKAWGNVGSNKGLGQLDRVTHAAVLDTAPATGGAYTFCPFGLDLEAFQRVAIESGVNTADRSLPISLILKGTNDTNAVNVDCYVLADALFYINADGSMSVSV